MRLAALIALSFAAPAVAKDPLLSLPIDCELGKTCFIQQYPDSDPSAAWSDFTCGPLSYDGHKGTDFRVPTLNDMNAGVAVLSAAPGTVTATRDGMADIAINASDAPDLGGKDCGNGLVINHGGGWETQYCHLKNGSLAVAKGDRVAKGTNLGQVGLSGRTVFPHLHLSVRYRGEVVDPFNPDNDRTCNAPADTLWEDLPPYQPGGLLDIGFHDAVPEFAQLKVGLPDPENLPEKAPALVLWSYAFGSREGDVMRFDIRGPEGWRFSDEVTLTRTQAEFFRAVGKREPASGWPQGKYTGQVDLIRGDKLIDTDTITTTIGG